MVFLGVGLSNIFNVSALLSNMFFGFLLTNIDTNHREHVAQLESYAPPIYCLFFVLAGAQLDFHVFKNLGFSMTLWAGVYIISRFLGKVFGVYFGAKITKTSPKISNNLGLGLLPMAGVAVGLSMLIDEGSYYFAYKHIILNITMAAVAVNELVGPILTKIALTRADEAIIHKAEKKRTSAEFNY